MIYVLVLESFVYILSLIRYKHEMDPYEHFGAFGGLLAKQINKVINISVHVDRHACLVSVDITTTIMTPSSFIKFQELQLCPKSFQSLYFMPNHIFRLNYVLEVAETKFGII